jgi:hypothetical protein
MPHCLNVTHLIISFVLWRLCSVVFIMSSLLCALPHTILPCGNISISCFYITCLLPVLRSFAQWHPAWKVILVILSGMADLNQNIEWSGVGCGKKRVWSGLGCGKEDGCSLSYTVDWSRVWQVWLVWLWPRPSWTTLYTCAATNFVPLVLFWNRSILLCFLPVYFQKLLWLRPSSTTLYTHCTHVQQVQMMRLRRVVLYSPAQLNTTWRQPDISFVYETSPTFRWWRRRRRRKIAICWPRPS